MFVEAALDEIFRTLRPGGRAVILETDWDTLVWNSTNPRLMDRMMTLYKDAYADARVPRTLSKAPRGAGFEIRGRDQFAMLNWSLEPDSFSGRRIDFIGELLEDHHKLSRDEMAEWRKSIRMAADADEYFFSLNRYVFCAVKPSPPAS